MCTVPAAVILAVGATLVYPDVAAAVGKAMFADLTSVAGKVYKHGLGYSQVERNVPRRLAIHSDEFNDLIGDEFIPMVNKAGGAGYQVIAYTQTWADVQARIGDGAKAEKRCCSSGHHLIGPNLEAR